MRVFFSLLIILSWLVSAFGDYVCPTSLTKACATCEPVPQGSQLDAICLTCQDGYALSSSSCFQKCIDGKFFYKSQCYACDIACATCNEAGKCLTCNATIGKPLMYKDYCYPTCPVATFQSNTTTCQACPEYCSSCINNSSCSACQTGRYLSQNTCYDKCPDGTYGDSNFRCQPCLSPCTKCTSDTTCQACSSGKFLYNSSCLGVCPIGSYLSNLVCEKCPTGCSACTSATACSTCLPGFYFNNNKCYGICPSGTFGNSLYQCSSCSSGCATCTGSASSCLSCSAGYFAYGSQCRSSCSGSLFQLNDGECASCVGPCTSCSGPKQCSTCSPGSVQYGSFCAANFTDDDPNPSVGCLGSIPNCAACLNKDSCLYCDDGYYLYGSCQPSCPSGTYEKDSACESCGTGCNQCSDVTSCSSCSSAYHLFGGQCVSSCPLGYFPNGNCQACPTGCASCTSTSICTLCQDGYLMSGTTCVQTCPAKTYPAFGVCTSCSSHCTTCVDGAKCNVCETGGWNLLNYICSAQCPTGFSKENGTCQGCPVGCTNCDDTKACGACDNGYAFYQKTCSFKCPDGTFDVTGVCQDCVEGCRLCNNDKECLQCKIEYVFFNQTCFSGCPDGFYNLDGICSVCPIGCATCTSAKLCQSCVWGYNIHFTDVCALDITPEEIKEVKGMAATTEATETASTAISSLYAFMNSGDPTAMFMGSLAKMLQYCKYINIEYPPKIKLLFGLQSNVNDTSESIVTKVQNKIVETSDSPQLENSFGYFQLTSSFVSNSLKSLGTLAGIVAGIGANYLVLYYVSPSSKVYQICKSLMGILKWNLFLLMFCGMVGDIVFFSSFEFRNANFENAFSVFSFVVCLLTNFLSIFVFYKLIQVNMNLQKSRNLRIARKHEADFMKDAESKWESCKVFFHSYKNKNLSQQAFMIFFLMRVISFYLIIAYFSAYPFLQMIMITFVSLLIVIYLIVVRPFKSILNNLNQIIFESIILSFNGCVLVLAELDTAKSNNYLLRKKLETALLDINLAAGFISTAFIALKALVVAWDLYKDWRLKKNKAQSPLSKFKKNRLANRDRALQKASNNNFTTNPDTSVVTHPDFSSQNMINIDTNMDQIYVNQSFDINPPLNQSILRNHNMISYTPSSSSNYSPGDHQRSQQYQSNQDYDVFQGHQAMPMTEFQSDSPIIKKSSTSSSSPRRIKKRAARLQDGQVWESQEKSPDVRNQIREDDLNKARIRRIQKQNKLNEIDLISL